MSFRRLLLFALCSLLVPAAQAQSAWAPALIERIRALDAAAPGEWGVYVKDVTSGHVVAYRADESWYLASGVKLPVAVALLRGVDAGHFALDDLLAVQSEDLVDGAGPTKALAPGQQVRTAVLLERMITLSDNAASDMLIRRAGLERVNALVREIDPHWGPITRLSDVRRELYAEFHPAARQLSGPQLLQLRAQPFGAPRIAGLARLLRVSPRALAPLTLPQAYQRYYARGLNSAPLASMGLLIERLVDGHLLQPVSREYLLAVMQRTRTGSRRLRAGLPQGLRFAEKTGTQYAHFCDFGALDGPRAGGTLIVAACLRGEPSLAAAERGFQALGQALDELDGLRGGESS